MSTQNNLFDRFRREVRRAAPAAFAVAAVMNLAACGKNEDLSKQLSELNGAMPSTLALSLEDLDLAARSVGVETAYGRGSHAGVAVSGDEPYSAVLDLGRNTLTWFDREGNVSRAPTDMRIVEEAKRAERISYVGSADARYHGRSEREKESLMSEPTRVLNCDYENACISQVMIIRGAPGDPRGFPASSMEKQEGGEVRFLEDQRSNSYYEQPAQSYSRPSPPPSLSPSAPASGREEEMMRAMAAARQGGYTQRAPASASQETYSYESASQQNEDPSTWEQIKQDQVNNLEWELRNTANSITYEITYAAQQKMRETLGGILR